MIFLSLIFDVFKTLLVLKPNLKEVIEAISPFDFVFRFSTVENLIGFNSVDNIIKIGKIVIETIDVIGNAGIRTGYIKTNFKRIFSINLVGFITKGQNESHLMQQVMHTTGDDIVKNKFFQLYTAGNQTVSVTIIGEI